jgi:hypothetical protein
MEKATVLRNELFNQVYINFKMKWIGDMKGNYTVMVNSYIHIHLKLSELLEGKGTTRLHLPHVFLLKFDFFFSKVLSLRYYMHWLPTCNISLFFFCKRRVLVYYTDCLNEGKKCFLHQSQYHKQPLSSA